MGFIGIGKYSLLFSRSGTLICLFLQHFKIAIADRGIATSSAKMATTSVIMATMASVVKLMVKVVPSGVGGL